MLRTPAIPPHAPEVLVLRICHEVGNLLAAVRLQAGLGVADAGPRIAELVGRAGALLGLVRPLLASEADPSEAAHPRALLEGLPSALDNPADPRLSVDLEDTVPLPAVAIEPDALQLLVLAELFAAFAELPEGGRMRVAAQGVAGGVAVVLDGPGREPEPEPLVGRALTLALAQALLARRGGEVRRLAGRDSLRVEFVVPAV